MSRLTIADVPPGTRVVITGWGWGVRHADTGKRGVVIPGGRSTIHVQLDDKLHDVQIVKAHPECLSIEKPT